MINQLGYLECLTYITIYVTLKLYNYTQIQLDISDITNNIK